MSSYSSEGRLRWRLKLEPATQLSPPIVDESGSVYVAAKVPIGDDFWGRGRVIAIGDDDGRVRWTLDLERPLTGPPVITPQGELLVGGDNRVFAFSSAGQLLWQRRLHQRDDWSNLVTRLEPTTDRIVGSADKTFALAAPGAKPPEVAAERAPGGTQLFSWANE